MSEEFCKFGFPCFAFLCIPKFEIWNEPKIRNLRNLFLRFCLDRHLHVCYFIRYINNKISVISKTFEKPAQRTKRLNLTEFFAVIWRNFWNSFRPIKRDEKFIGNIINIKKFQPNHKLISTTIIYYSYKQKIDSVVLCDDGTDAKSIFRNTRYLYQAIILNRLFNGNTCLKIII